MELDLDYLLDSHLSSDTDDDFNYINPSPYHHEIVNESDSSTSSSYHFTHHHSPTTALLGRRSFRENSRNPYRTATSFPENQRILESWPVHAELGIRYGGAQCEARGGTHGSCDVVKARSSTTLNNDKDSETNKVTEQTDCTSKLSSILVRRSFGFG